MVITAEEERLLLYFLYFGCTTLLLLYCSYTTFVLLVHSLLYRFSTSVLVLQSIVLLLYFCTLPT